MAEPEKTAEEGVKPEEKKDDAAAKKEDDADDAHKEAPSAAVDAPDPDAEYEKVFSDKAILYRYDQEAKEWKERGSGELKILKKAGGATLVVLRRAQTFKLAANHAVPPVSDIKPHGDSGRAFLWHAVDHSDGKPVSECFCAKFKNAEVAQQFKTAFDEGSKGNAALGPAAAAAAEVAE